MGRILIVEDEPAIANLIKMNLSMEGYDCTIARDGKEGADYIEKESFDLILLDIMLPEIDGYELLDYIAGYNTPVIFVTARGTVEDKIKGLKLGAEDYIVKPFQIGELIARVDVIFRRLGKENSDLQFEHIRIDLPSRTLYSKGEQVYLTAKEFDLFVMFVENKNIALHRERLYEKVWGEEYLGETRTLDAHVQRLRKKLDLEDYIKTVFRIGYRLEGG